MAVKGGIAHVHLATSVGVDTDPPIVNKATVHHLHQVLGSLYPESREGSVEAPYCAETIKERIADQNMAIDSIKT